jgi:pimeloyl-ACP methyl ester carboxylesterase
LVATHVPPNPLGAIIVMHGGGRRRDEVEPVSARQPSVLRMVPIARRIAKRESGKLAVFRLLNTHRGWHADHTPVDDATLALAELQERFGPLPTTLVGHSLGARAALLGGAFPGVTSVVALNAYVYDRDATIDLAGRRVLFVHGDRDRVASFGTAEAVARRLAESTDIEFVRVRGGNHSMLARRDAFDRATGEFISAAHGTPASTRADTGEISPAFRVRTV